MKKVGEKFDILLGEELRIARKNKGLTLEQVGARIGCVKQTMSAYEKGQVALGINTLVKICEIYGVKYYELIDRASEKMYGKI